MELQFVALQRLFEFIQAHRVVGFEVVGDRAREYRGEVFEGGRGAGEEGVGGPELAVGVFGPADEVAADEDGFVAGLGVMEIRKLLLRRQKEKRGVVRGKRI